MARTAASTKDETIDDLHAQIATLKSDIAILTSTVKDLGIEKKDNLSAAASAGAEILKMKGQAAMHDAQVTAKKAAEQAETTVRENPAAAVGIAAGVGFLVGMFAGRR
ncbi:DUF883 family protein [Marivivens niveibacter]|nr:DUF883 family protein [Marivivens niveibacter]